MAIRTTEVTLSITYDDSKWDDPAKWDWDGALDMAPNESITVKEA